MVQLKMSRKMNKSKRILERETLNSAIKDFLSRGGRIKNVSMDSASIQDESTNGDSDVFSYLDFYSPSDEANRYTSRKYSRLHDYDEI